MRYFYTLAICLLAGHAVSFAQAVFIRGKVRSNVDSVLAGVSVVIKGTTKATVTNTKGEFSIAVPKLPATLVVSFVAYRSKEIVLKRTDSSKFISVKLYPIETTLDEVVVVGFGSAKRRDVTGSVARTKSESFSAAIESKAAGISVSKAEKATGARPAGTDKLPARNAKILTAGELSDFKKWNLWEGYTKAEFSQWSKHWGIAPVNRYCVQVQNEDSKGIVGENIYLIDRKTNDTAWRAVSDNTGKAELWAGINTADSSQNKYSIVCGTQIIRNAVTFENGINRIIVKRDCAQSTRADIAFVVDATGSMADEIQYLQDELQDVIAGTTAGNKGVNLYLGAVFYRDHGDDYLTRSIDFQNDPEPLMKFIKEQSADGGGDYQEAVDDALTVALDSLHWDNGARAKIIFLILDAPPHLVAKDKMKHLMIQAAAMGVRVVPVVCSGINKSAEYLMRSLALTTNGSYVFLTDDSGVGDKHIKPTTDNFKVELLNDLLQRLIAEMIFMPLCNDKGKGVTPGNPDNNIAKLAVYPNPSAGKIQIRSSEVIKELYIADFTGKVLEKINTNNKSQNWQTDLSNYPSGTYLIRYFIEQKGWGAEKVLLIK